MPGDLEQSLLMRRFSGVDQTRDPAFLPPETLQLADGFIPSIRFLCSKRQGVSLLRQLTAATGLTTGTLTVAPVIRRSYDDQGNRFLHVVARSTLGQTVDAHYASINDGAFAVQTGVPFSPNSGTTDYSMAQLGNLLFTGNGIDPLIFQTLGSPLPSTIALTALTDFTDGSAAPTETANDVNADLPSGTYSYAWAIYDHTNKKYTKRSQARMYTLRSATDVSLSFPIATGTTLTGGERFHFFIASVNLPIELATDHTPEGITAGATQIRKITNNGPFLPLKGPVRTGKYLLVHRNRLWVAGDVTVASSGANASRVYATTIVVPGLEQDAFDQGAFFPENAVLNVARSDGDVITGMGIAALTVTTDSPTAALLIFKNTATYAFTGDILGDPNADLFQLSGRVGCVSHHSIVSTPIGTIFLGHDSVYVVRAERLEPLDIGQPIWSVIRAIPKNVRSFACAVFHRGFYKLAIPPVAGSLNTQEWWLDLRTGFGESPSWWGPQNVPARVAFTNARRDTAEDDRAFALQPQGNVIALDQDGIFTDLADDRTGTTTVPIASRLRTASLDAGAPFDRKKLTRLRVNGRANAIATSIGVQVTLDSGLAMSEGPLTLTGSVGAQWNSAQWNVSTWSALPAFREAESIFSPERPRGVSADVILTHTDPVQLDLRDLELRYLPVDRRVA